MLCRIWLMLDKMQSFSNTTFKGILPFVPLLSEFCQSATCRQLCCLLLIATRLQTACPSWNLLQIVNEVMGINTRIRPVFMQWILFSGDYVVWKWEVPILKLCGVTLIKYFYVSLGSVIFIRPGGMSGIGFGHSYKLNRVWIFTHVMYSYNFHDKRLLFLLLNEKKPVGVYNGKVCFM